MTGYCTFYVTERGRDEAVNLSRILLQEKLVACANISGVMTSLYEWDGKICQDDEVAIFLKTRISLADKVTCRIKEIHTYDTPCIVRWDITGGNADYLKWVGESVRLT